MKYGFFFLFLLFFLVLSKNGVAQEIIYSNDNNDSNTSSQTENYVNNSESSKVKKDPRISYNLEVGSVFSFNKAYGNSLSFYTAPQLKYRLAPKLSITAGIMLINTSISDYYNNENQRKNNFNQAYFFSGFDYKANQKLSLRGEILYGKNKSPNGFNNVNKQDYAMKFSAEYKINENFSIGLQVINQNLGYPSYGNSLGYYPFGNNYEIYSPFDR